MRVPRVEDRRRGAAEPPSLVSPLVRLALGLVCGSDPIVVEAQLAFHLAVGADVAVVAGPAAGELASHHGRDERVVVLDEPDVESADDLLGTMAELAGSEHGAEWIVPCEEGWFWWPRGADLHEVLAPMPARYGSVRGLERVFAASTGTAYFAERMTARSAEPPRGRDPSAADDVRPLVRSSGDGLVPLRGWHPLEVLRFPQASEPSGAEVDAGLADGSLVVDTRLRDALRELAGVSELDAVPTFVDDRTLVLPRPSVVETALYAIESTGAGEAELAPVEERIVELEARVDVLERRSWPRLARAIRRLRGGRHVR